MVDEAESSESAPIVENMSKPQLQEYATGVGIDITGLSTKTMLIEAIKQGE